VKLGLLRRSLVAALLLSSALPHSVAQTAATRTPTAHSNSFDARAALPAAPTPHRTASRIQARALAAHALRREKDKTDARALAASRVQDAATEAQRVAALPAQELLSEDAQRLGGDKLAMKASEDRIALHPSCDTLQKAARLFAKSARYDKARALEDVLKDCGPLTLASADPLSQRMTLARATESAAGAAGGK